MEKPQPVVVKVVTPEDREEAYRIRIEVFVTEQGYPEEGEIDHYDAVATHLILVFPTSDTPRRAYGTVRMVTLPDGTGKLGRLCVAAKLRGMGAGALLVRALEKEAKEMGLSAIVLSAQVHAKGFYEKLGYGFPDGGVEYMDDGAPHVKMAKTL
ncbi:acyl-CoA N-acyltransferase [Blyttiomyces helicus]|uniref:Glucosamine 6-phosphate N-acetyltransferase n=1 Tax=Blyttiomyces helicus TaxID=388810 RepID=A0A4P9VZ19_9FUNG|nr:acyl-CoA N-acyltransferase [Blyttiomyces helicus]|eukprot:RKO83588.1 acyl-CoA N-acyltransferase [Blyttiomyces helicus]